MVELYLVLSVRDVPLAQAECPQPLASHLSQVGLAGLLNRLLRSQAGIDHAVSSLTVQPYPVGDHDTPLMTCLWTFNRSSCTSDTHLAYVV